MNKLKGYYYLLILCLCTFNFIKVNGSPLPLKDKIIYIDPGHGGLDSGASYKDILEKDINLEISHELMTKLENKGATVYMTRYDDYDLSNNGVSFRKKSDLYNRVKVINNSKADLYLSIHLNSIESSKWSGVQIFYDDINNENIKIAKKLQETFDSNRQIALIKGKYMYNKITIPGVLIELGFLSNSTDRSNLLNEKTRDKMIDNIVSGIISYYN